MENEIKKIILKIVYDELGLEAMEKEFEDNGVPKMNIVNPNNEEIISNYFFLKNDINFNYVGSDELEKLNKYLELGMVNEATEIVRSNMMNFIKRDENDPMIVRDMFGEMKLDDDVVVLNFYTKLYDLEENDARYEKEDFVNDRLNRLQLHTAPAHNLRVAVESHNELDYFNKYARTI